MKSLLRLANLDFLPANASAAQLILRIWVGVSMFFFHGMGKLTKFSELSTSFPDPFGVGHTVSLVLALLAEVVGSILLILGLFTRLSATLGVITMATAFVFVHGAKLPPTEGHGEMAFIYMAIYAALVVAGAGRYSLDAKLNLGR
ncbi:MAG TPA: DoxX family protein [Chthoniobacteraceae bacterium]|nr:DoxX family protein [Chthoniobacteraceae bacterium]